MGKPVQNLRSALGAWVLMVWIGAAFSVAADVSTTNLSDSTTGTVSDGSTKIPYRLFHPQLISSSEKVPLILFLHGAGDRGTDNIQQTYWMKDLQENTDSGADAAFILAPQIGQNMWFSSTGSETQAMSLTMKALRKAMKNPNVDTSRIYVTGVSMGSFGTWDILRRYPKLFAAAIPMSGGGDPSTAETIKNIPIWAFHGSADPVVPVQTTENMIAALRAVGGHPLYTEVAGGGHYIWPQEYENPMLYQWLFSQRLTPAASKAKAKPKSVPHTVARATTAQETSSLSPQLDYNAFAGWTTTSTGVSGLDTIATSSSVPDFITGSATFVPEPSSILFVGLAIVGLSHRRRRA